MGGWLVLLILRAIAKGDSSIQDLPSIEGAILISPAWDMTEELMWNEFPEAARTAIETQGFYERPSVYGDGAYKISKKLIEEGRDHLIGKDKFTPPCPVRIIHGIEDPDVPWLHVNKLNRMLLGENVMLTLIQEGDHRLSRPKDIEKMLYIVNDLYKSLSRNHHLI